MTKQLVCLLIISVLAFSALAWEDRIFPYEGEGEEAVAYFENLVVDEVFENFLQYEKIDFVSVYGFTIITPGTNDIQITACHF